MGPKKPELAVLFLTLLAFAVMGGFYLGRNTVAGPVRVVTRSGARAVQQPEESFAASAPAQPPEESTAASAPAQPPDGDTQDAFPVNINTATAEELQALPGIGETRAQAIVAYREEHGPFTYVEDLRAVSGIGEGILANIMDYITVGERDNGEDLSG